MNPKESLLSIALGVACGIVSTRTALAGSWYNLLLWTIVGLALGFFYTEKKTMLWSGGVYGFFLSISFLFLGFEGTPDKFWGFALFSLVLSIIGALYGALFGRIGGWLRTKIRHSENAA